VLLRWCPDEVREGMNMSIAEALTALVSKYLECVVAAEQTEVEEFFSTFIGRGRVREAINALLAAREFQFTHVGSRSMLHIPPPKPVKAAPRPLVRPGQPIARRPRPGAPARPPAPVSAKAPEHTEPKPVEKSNPTDSGKE
jgi:hypothetical protein